MTHIIRRYAATPFRKLTRLMRGEKLFANIHSKEQWDAEFRIGRWEQLTTQHANSGNMAVIGHLLMFSVGDGPTRLLDVGCGNGALLRTLDFLKCKFEYVGVDVSGEALAQLKTAHPAAITVCADMLDIEALPGTFDIVVFAECLYYVDYDAAIRSYRNVLRTGGLAIVSLPDSAHGRILWSRVRRELKELQSFTVRNDLSASGWTVKLMQYR